MEKVGKRMNPPNKWFYHSEKNSQIVTAIPRIENSSPETVKILIPITFNCLKKIKPFITRFYLQSEKEYKNVILIFVIMHHEQQEEKVSEDTESSYLENLETLVESYRRVLEHFLAAQPLSIQNQRLKIFRKIFFLVPHDDDQKKIFRYLGFYPKKIQSNWAYIPGFIFLNHQNIIQRITILPEPWEVLHTMENILLSEKKQKINIFGIEKIKKWKNFFLSFNNETLKWNISFIRVSFVLLTLLLIIGWMYYFKGNYRNGEE